MKIRTRKSDKIETQMAPMIDVVFQLLIFFMLTLKISEPEGDFNINMPISGPAEQSDELPLPDLKVRLISDANGNLAEVRLGSDSLGNGPDVFSQLNARILKIVGTPTEKPSEQQVEIDADYNLRYEYGVHAIGACTGKKGPGGQLIRYVEKIKFAKVKKPQP